MKNKQAIENLIAKATNLISYMHNDIDSNKPHVTVDYIKEQLRQSLLALETTQQYLDLED